MCDGRRQARWFCFCFLWRFPRRRIAVFPMRFVRSMGKPFTRNAGQSFLAMYQAGEEADYWFEAGADTAFVQRMDRRIQQIEAQVGETEPIDVYVLRDATMVADRLAEPIFQENALILTASLEETCLPALANKNVGWGKASPIWWNMARRRKKLWRGNIPMPATWPRWAWMICVFFPRCARKR